MQRPGATILGVLIAPIALSAVPARVFADDAPTPASAPTIRAIRLGAGPASTRAVVDLDGPVVGARMAADAPDDRVDLTFASAAAPAVSSGAGAGLVLSWSSAAEARGERISFRLRGLARVSRRFLLPPAPGSTLYRYVIDFTAGPPVSASADLATGAATAVAVPVSPPGARAQIVRFAAPRVVGARRARVIVIDAGHGGHDSGALGPTRAEKDLTLAAAKALKMRLERTGRYRVILTREADTFVPLEARVRIARQGGADLFLSLHADSAGADTATHGASVYTLSDLGGGRVRYVLGRDEWFTRVAARSDAGVGQILLDLTQRSTRNRSALFAGLLLDHLAGRVDLLPRGHRDAGYFVLLAPDVPAALLEMGFITNPQDEARLADPLARERMMDAVTEAIEAYFGETRRIAAS